jgi:hypothetical protein
VFFPRRSHRSRHTLRRAGVLVPGAALLTLAAGVGTATSAGALATPSVHFTPMTLAAVEGGNFKGPVIGFTVDFGLSIASELAQVAVPGVTIDWGDGSALTGGDVKFHSGAFTVSGEHVWTEHGTYTVTVAISGAGDLAAVFPAGSGQSTANVGDAALKFKGTAPEVKGFTGQPITVSGEFRDDNPFGQLSDLSATLTEGDGTAPVAATVSAIPDGTTVHPKPLDYLVSGDGVYSEPGIHHALLTLTDKGGSSADHEVTVKVQQNPLAVVPAITAVEGTAFSGKLATFTLPHDNGPDVSVPSTSMDYTVDWGDGSTKGTGSFDGGDISGSHVYAEEGTYTYTVTVTADVHPATATHKLPTFFGTGTATVADAALSATGIDGTATAGTAFTKVVAHFTDANPLTALEDFTTAPGGASITWGDGSAASAGTIVSASGGGYDVSGTHTYAAAGTYTVTISIKDMGGATATATATYTVSGAAGGVQGITSTTGGSIGVPSTGGGPGQG